VQRQIPPDVDGSASTAKVLAKLHPEDDGSEVFLPAEAADWTDEIEAAKEQIKTAEVMKQAAENRLKAAIGDATFGLLPDGSRWSWKSQTRKSYVVEEATFRVLRRSK
jgi:predicted phage-related endonuclease